MTTAERARGSTPLSLCFSLSLVSRSLSLSHSIRRVGEEEGHERRNVVRLSTQGRARRRKGSRLKDNTKQGSALASQAKHANRWVVTVRMF